MFFVGDNFINFYLQLHIITEKLRKQKYVIIILTEIYPALPRARKVADIAGKEKAPHEILPNL